VELLGAGAVGKGRTWRQRQRGQPGPLTFETPDE
jgi:hypothetical protein